MMSLWPSLHQHLYLRLSMVLVMLVLYGDGGVAKG